MKKLNLPQITIERNIKVLKMKKIIRRIGNDKNGEWKVIEDDVLI